MTHRSGPVAAALGAAALSGVLAVAAGPPAPAAGLVQAVVSYDGPAVALPGVRVLAGLPAIHAAVVRATVPALRRLRDTSGVRGVSADDVVGLTGGADRGADGVRASAGLGGGAGRAGAGAGVRVALVDSGVSDTAALSRATGRLVDAADTSGFPDAGVQTGGRYDDGYGHGTFMAGLIAGGPLSGPGEDASPALGVAPGATVLDVRVAGPDGTTSLSRVLAGLDWVAQHADQVDVVNLSLSHARPFTSYGADPLTDAVDALRARGLVVVASAGNEPGEVGDPGQDPLALTVGAADLRTHRTAAFSGSAVVAGMPRPDIVASGVHVLGLLPPDSVLARGAGTARPDRGLYRGSGTSQATAVTSGVVSLLLAEHPGLSPAQVTATLRCGARPLPGSRDGAGLVRANGRRCDSPDGAGPPAGGGDPGGEVFWDASSWAASSWAASSWAASSWAASSWAASSWAAVDGGQS